MAGVFDERAPLLLSDRAEKWVGVASGSDGDGADPKGQRPLAELIFLASVLRPYGALWLTVLSVLESGVTAASGMMYGRFYQAFIDRDAGLFLRTLLFAGLLFAMSAAIAATTDFAAEFLSNRWRWRLGFAAQHQYCRGRGLLRAASLDTPDQRLTQDLRDFCDSLSRVLKVVLAAPLRVVWYGTLGVRLVGAGSVLAAVTFFAAGSAAQAFLVKSIARLVADQERMEGTLRAAHVRLWDRREDVAMSRAQGAESAVVMRALSRAVDNQGRIVFRRWLLAAVSQILDYGGSVVNYAVIGAAVFLAPRAAGDGGDVARLVSTASFATLMLINSLTQVLGTARDCADLAGLAARVGAALRVLGLTHAHVARMGKGGKGGYANEHGTAMRAYGGWTAPRPRNSIDSVTSRDSMSRQGSLFGASPGIERRGRDGAGPGVLPGVGAPHPEACTVQPPTLFCLHDGGKASPTAMGGQRGGGASASNGSAGMEGGARAGGEASVGWSAGDAAWLPGQLEVSVHALGPPLAAVVAGVFPDAPIHSPGTLTAIVTMQCSQVELAGDGGTEVAEEMDRMLQTFFRASKAVEAVLGRLGHWSCSIDPLTGLAMRGTPGERYSEVRGARTLLGYSVNDAGPLPLLSHPVVGTRVYPATLFTTAPPDAAAAAVREALSRAPTVAYPPWPHRQAGPAIVTDAGGSGAAPVVALTGVSCALPDGRWAVRGLTVSVPAGGALLLRGPSGCGKTTLLRSLCGLRPLHSGHVALPPHDRVMFLPQRPLLAVGTGEDPGLTTLRQQVVYPLSVTASGSFDEETRVREAVEGAGLGDALARVGGDVDREARWGAAMSPGEQQRVAVARVLYHRPLVAFLDESTNALPGDAEAAVYAALRARGVAVVTVGHGASLEALHDAVVEIEGGGQGRWAMRDAGAGSSGTGHGR